MRAICIIALVVLLVKVFVPFHVIALFAALPLVILMMMMTNDFRMLKIVTITKDDLTFYYPLTGRKMTLSWKQIDRISSRVGSFRWRMNPYYEIISGDQRYFILPSQYKNEKKLHLQIRKHISASQRYEMVKAHTSDVKQFHQHVRHRQKQSRFNVTLILFLIAAFYILYWCFS